MPESILSDDDYNAILDRALTAQGMALVARVCSCPTCDALPVLITAMVNPDNRPWLGVIKLSCAPCFEHMRHDMHVALYSEDDPQITGVASPIDPAQIISRVDLRVLLEKALEAFNTVRGKPNAADVDFTQGETMPTRVSPFNAFGFGRNVH